MTSPIPPVDPSALATVIPMDGERRRRQHDRLGTSKALVPAPVATVSAQAELDRALGVLQRRLGESGFALPADLGRPSARLAAVLEKGPTGVDSARTPAALALEIADVAAAAARVTLDLAAPGAALLGEALGSDLDGLSLPRLVEVADAVVGLGQTPAVPETWAEPGACEAATAVLEALAEDLQDASLTHAWLYERFTDHVWDVPERLLRAGLQPWRLFSRMRLRGELRSASRHGRLQERVGNLASRVLAARSARARLTSLSPVLSQHLGVLDHGPLTDVGEVARAVRAVRRLQLALGDRIDVARLSRLLLADAFRQEEVFGPAVNLRLAIGAWQRDLVAARRVDSGGRSIDLAELDAWTQLCEALVPPVRDGLDALVATGHEGLAFQQLVDLLLLRQHAAELEAIDGHRNENENANEGSGS